MTSFRKCHILKPKGSSPKQDSNLHNSVGGRLGKQTCSPLHHASLPPSPPPPQKILTDRCPGRSLKTIVQLLGQILTPQCEQTVRHKHKNKTTQYQPMKPRLVCWLLNIPATCMSGTVQTKVQRNMKTKNMIPINGSPCDSLSNVIQLSAQLVPPPLPSSLPSPQSLTHKQT